MSRKIKLLAVTGIRSEYDILYPVIDGLRKDERFEVKIVASGAHLSDWHGFTLKSIEEDGFEIADKIDSLFMTDRRAQRAKGTGVLTSALSQTVDRENPDFLLVVGDREESIAVAVVGNYMDVLVAHIGGGDPVFGNADDPIRFAVSKLAHIHFTSTQQYAENLKKIGEEEFRIFNVGSPALDNIKNTEACRIEEISDFLGFDISGRKYVVLIKHPLSSEKENSYFQMRVTLESLEAFCMENNIKVIGIHPNTDPGSIDILKAIHEFKDSKFIKFHKTLPRKIFINLVRNAKALVGNSSMGILEAPFYGLPVVNVGNRQKGRLNAGNVEFVSHDKEEIRNALRRAYFDERYRDRVKNLENPYGNGTTSQKIRDILTAIDKMEKKWYMKERLC